MPHARRDTVQNLADSLEPEALNTRARNYHTEWPSRAGAIALQVPAKPGSCSCSSAGARLTPSRP